MKLHLTVSRAAGLAGAAALSFTLLAGAQAKQSVTSQATILHQFSGLDGASPNGSLLRGPDGTIYGTTYNGGANKNGTVFSLSPSGIATVLHSFAGTPHGLNPCGQIALASDGTIYGTALTGGAHGGGVVYKISPSGVYTVLHSFGDGSGDGVEPFGGLTLASDGNLYGLTFMGGQYGEGVVYACTADGGETILHSFGPLDGNGDNSDGALSYAALAEGPDGALYGTTAFGGANGAGTVFKIRSNRDFQILHSFSAMAGAADGANPYAGLVAASDGNLYGTTYSGGANNAGTIYRLDSSGHFTLLHSFAAVAANNTNDDGAHPSSPLVQGTDGKLYGAAGYGGVNGGGSLFDVVDASGQFSVAYQCPTLQADNTAAGAVRPYGGVATLPDGTLAVAGYYGGSAADGAVVIVNPNATSTQTSSATLLQTSGGGQTAIDSSTASTKSLIGKKSH